MKINRIAFIFSVVLISILLTSCGPAPIPAWPGLSVDQDVVYVADGSSLSAVYAAGEQAGTQKWRYPADKLDASKQIFAEPTVSNGLVLVGSQYASNTVLYALDAATGAEKWTFTAAKGKWLASPVVTGSTIIAPNGDGTIYAIGLDGKPGWKFQAKAGFWATPVTDGKLVYAPSQDRNLYAIDVANGNLIWTITLDAAALYRPILVNGEIYLSTLAKQVVAINPGKRAIDWKVSLDGTVFGSPVIVGDTLFIADESKLYSISVTNHSNVKKYDLPGIVTATVTPFSKGIVVVTDVSQQGGAVSGNVMGFSEAGEKLFSQSINGKLYSRPVVVQDTIIVGVTAPSGGTIDNLLIAYDSAGKVTWSLPVPK